MSHRETWIIDTTHSVAEFELQHMHVSTYRSQFSRIEGKVSFESGSPSPSHIEASIDVASLAVLDKPLRDRLLDPEFFDAAAHPNITWSSSSISPAGEGRWRAEGELTIKGITRSVALDVEALGGGNHPFARKPMRGFVARASLDRGDFGMKWNATLDTGAAYLGEKVNILLQIELLKID